jgi:hypothetical protein
MAIDHQFGYHRRNASGPTGRVTNHDASPIQPCLTNSMCGDTTRSTAPGLLTTGAARADAAKKPINAMKTPND